MSHRTFIALSALILLVAAALRLYDLPSYPPGPHYDEAVYLTMTRSIAFGGARFFPIVEAYQGREVLWMYLNAPLLSLFGDRVLTLRYASAFANLITLAACMGLARAMFPGKRGQLVALAAGAAFALSFPQVWLARQAFRAVTLPLCQALALWLLWRGLRADKRAWLWLTLAGFVAGSAIYTYMASRLFPLWLFIAAAAFVVWSWRAAKANRILQTPFQEPHPLIPSPSTGEGERAAETPPLHAMERGAGGEVRMMALFIGVMLLTIAPMVVYAIQKPDIFFGRLAEVTRPEDAVTLWESVVLHARMFFIAGDPYVRYNIPARPYFTLPEGIILMLGVGVCLYRIARGRGDAAARTGYLLALLSPLMIVPSVISVSGLPPSHMRSLGMIPLIFVLLGVGVEWLTSRVRERMTASPDSLSVLERRQGGEVALILVLLIGGLSVGTLYFDWATRADVYYETDADLSAAARWLAAGADGDLTDTVIYLAARDKGHPTAMIEAIPPVRWIGTDTLFRAPPTMDGLYVFPRSAPPVEEWRAWLEPGRITDLPLAPDGRTAFEAFRLSGATMLPIQAPSETVRNPYMTLLGIDAPPIPSGEADWVTTFWQVDAVPPFADFTPLISLEDEAGEVFRGDAYMTETDRWLPGEVMVLRLRVSVPIGTPPARYALSIRWIGRASDQFVNTIGGGVSARVGTLLVARALAFPDPATLDIPVRCADCTVNEGVALLGWNPLPTTLRPGAGFVLTTVWHALRDQPQNPISLLFGTDDAPLLPHYAVDYRPNRWTRGEIMMVRARYQIPSTLQSGSYEIRLQGRDAVISLGSVSVEGIARRYDAPPVDGRSEVVFGNAIALYGYTLEHSADAFHVALVWRADAPIDRDYSVFVHRLDTEGNIIDQRDAQPANGATPTSLWLPGEYIIDNYTFSPDDRVIALRIGLYTPDDGQRLRVDMGGDFALIPLDSASP